jgi:two-component system phosphate regulon response regulator PhoB
MQTVLIVEDDKNIANLVSYNLKQEKFDVISVITGEEGLRQVKIKIPDLIILDIMLPGIDGLEVCRKLKSDDATRNIPILMLTAKSEEIDKIVGFELGADDYVTKPFSPRELVLRVKSILKRGKQLLQKPSVLKFKEMTLIPDDYALIIGAKKIKLTLTEFKLLHFMINNKGRVLPRENILNHVWGYDSEVFSRTVDTHITRLREKLESYGKYLESVRGVGYRWLEN